MITIQGTDAIDFSWAGDYSYNRNLSLEALSALSASSIIQCEITHEIFKVPFAKLVLDESLDLASGNLFQVTDNYSVDGATASNIIFEGMITSRSTTYPYELTVTNRAFEISGLFPSGDQTNDSDGILNAIVGADNDYVVAGDLTDGADMGTLTYGGDKDQAAVFRNLAFFEGWIYYFKEAVENTSIKIDFNPGTTDTGITLDETDNIWDVKVGRAGRAYTKVVVNGSSGCTGSATASDEDIAIFGTNVFYHRDSSLNTNALCGTAATNILAILNKDPILLHFKYQDASIGFMQPGQTFTFEYDLDGVDEVLSQSFLINKIIYDALSGVGEIWASSSVTYDYKTLNWISQQLPQENSALLASLTSIETYTEWDDADPAAAQIDQGDLTIDTAWHELDLDSFVTVPSDAVGAWARVSVIDSASAGLYLFIRSTSQSNNPQSNMIRTQVVNVYNDGLFYIPLDSDHKFDYLASNGLDGVSIAILAFERGH